MKTFIYILKRLGYMILTFTIIFVMLFVLIKALPFEINITIGQDRAIAEALARDRGYYDPILVQLWRYLVRIFKYGDFGVGMNMPGLRGKPCWDEFVLRMPPTILINIYSTLVSVPIGIALGIFAALKKNKWQDHTISTTVMIFISVPSFVYSFLVQYFFCYLLGWFPLTMKDGYDYFTWEMIRSMIPAVIAMSFGSIAGYTRFTRAELTEVLTSEYMLLARTKGLTRAQATVRHALKNAMVPIFPSIVGEFISVLSGSLIIEQIFSIPGVGKLYLMAINSQDYDFFMLLSAFYILVGLTAGIVIDLSYGIIDPRIRMGEK